MLNKRDWQHNVEFESLSEIWKSRSFRLSCCQSATQAVLFFYPVVEKAYYLRLMCSYVYLQCRAVYSNIFLVFTSLKLTASPNKAKEYLIL